MNFLFKNFETFFFNFATCLMMNMFTFEHLSDTFTGLSKSSHTRRVCCYIAMVNVLLSVHRAHPTPPQDSPSQVEMNRNNQVACENKLAKIHTRWKNLHVS